MIKIINNLLNILKILLLIACFIFTFYIIVNMYNRLGKDLIGGLSNFVPFILLFILFSVNLIFKQKSINQCTFYNITCCLVFLMLLFSIYRTFNDKNMIMTMRLGYNMNFNYFSDMIAPMRFMLYTLSLANVLLMVTDLKIFNEKK